MEIAPLPSNEIERLKALHEYDVLDTPHEPLFDGIAELAAHICDVPIALISLVDGERQWFKAAFGMPNVTETPRDFSLCAYTILHNEMLEVADLLQDARFADSPLAVSAPNIRFYAGMPLINPQGFGLGSLCVIDVRPRRLSDSQRDALGCLSRLVISLLEQRKVTRNLRRSEERISRADAALGESERFLTSTLNALSQQLCVLDETGTIIAVNNAWRDFAIANGGRATSVSEGANYLAACNAVTAGGADEGRGFAEGIRAVLNGERDIFEIEYACHSPLQQRWFIAKVARFAGDGPRRAVITHSDISGRKSAEEQLLYQAHYDHLTNLPNRLLFRDRLENALAQAQRNHRITGVLFIDLDRFKVINDTLGHLFGDQLILLVSQRLIECLRDGDTVCRLGGDEFAVLLPDLMAADDANQVVQKIEAALAEPFILDGNDTFVSASIGIAIHPGDGEDADTLIRNADTAMYSAKALGGNNHQFYSATMNKMAVARMRLESSLRRALERGEFLLYYQPKLGVPRGEICGAEALLRWKHPERGLVSPAEFIPLLEETGLILPVGLWVLETACAQLRVWREAGLALPSIAINLSARQFQQADLDVRIRDIIAASGIAPADIELEITESMLMLDPQQAVAMLAKLKQLGVRISVDDFGTGYSSLAYLKQFPLDALKIDRAFISSITDDQASQDDATLALTIINLAHNLKLNVVAEGVETEYQAHFLTRHGCDVLQGFYFSRPVAPDDFAQLLSEPNRFTLPEAVSVVPCVLLMDDHQNLQLLERALRGEGYRILNAATPDHAFAQLANHRVDMVIADQSTPQLSGIEFLAQVKTLYPDAIRVVHAGLNDAEMIMDAVNNASVHKLMSNEWDLDCLRNTVREALHTAAA